MRRISILIIMVVFAFSLSIMPQIASGLPSKLQESQVGYVHNAFVVKFSLDFEGINPKAEKMIVLTGVWELDALNQYCRVDRMEPVLPWGEVKSEVSGDSRYYLIRCHPVVTLEEVMHAYLSLPFVDNVLPLGNRKFFYYMDDKDFESSKDNTKEPLIKPSADIPSEFSISQNYPNPFNAQTSFSVSLSRDTHVNIAVYNVMGQKVKTLIDDDLKAGIHMISWDGTNQSWQNVSSGVYLYRIVTQENIVTKKMILMK